MQTRSSSASSVATGATRKQYSAEEAEILMQKASEKERQLREQSEALQVKADYLTKMQEEMDRREAAGTQEQPAVEQLMASMHTITSCIERINSRLANLETSQKEEKQERYHTREERSYSQPTSQHLDIMDQPSPIRLKDAIDTVPRFDGHKMSVFHFSKICERALDLIPTYHEYYLVQLIINKLQGHAYSAIEGVEFHTVLELTKRLKLIFGPNKSVDQYRGELGNIYMKQNENIFDYIARVQELRTAIIDGESDLSGNISERSRDAIEVTTLNSFINGLPSDLLVRVKLERPKTFEESISTAIQLSKTIEAENIRKKTLFRPNFQPRADPPNITGNFTHQNHTNNNFNNGYRSGYRPNNGHTNSRPPYPATPTKSTAIAQSQQNFQTKICRYCKTPGHLIEECRKLAYKRTLETNQPGTSGNAQGVPLRTDVRWNDPQPGRPTYHIQKKVNITTPQETPVQISESAN